MNKKNLLRKGLSLIASIVMVAQLCGCSAETLHKLGVRTGDDSNYSYKTFKFQLDESYAGMTIEEADPQVISWLCGTYAIQTSINYLDLTIIGGMERGDKDLDFISGGLEAGWGIVDRETALDSINKLLTDDRVNSAWNSSRAMQLLGQSYCLGYIEFDEYMEYAIPLGKIIQENYSDWESFGNEYLEGYANWMRKRTNPDESQIAERQQMHQYFIEKRDNLQTGPYSIDFNLELH